MENVTLEDKIDAFAPIQHLWRKIVGVFFTSKSTNIYFLFSVRFFSPLKKNNYMNSDSRIDV